MTLRHSVPKYAHTGKAFQRPLAGRRTSGLSAARRMTLLCGVAALALAPAGPTAADVIIAGTEEWSAPQSTPNAYLVGVPDSVAGTLTLTAGGVVTMNTTDNTVASRLEVGNSSTGTLNIQGGGVTFNIAPSASTGIAVGQLFVGGGLESTGGTGTLNLSSGSISFVASGETSNFGRIAIGDGVGATGTVSQSGDTEIAFGTFGQIDIGVNGGTGTYSLEGNAAFTTDKGGSVHIGTGGAGSNGTLTLSDSAQFTLESSPMGAFILGDSGGTGAFTVSGGKATIGSDFAIANAAGSTGTVTQTGGVISITDGAKLKFGEGNGSYTLTDGELEIGGTDGISGDGTLTFGGGTLKVRDSNLTTSTSASLAGAFTVNTSGLGATLSGLLSGGGSLTKSGAGTLELTAANSYTGGTTISGGTLALSGSGGIVGRLVNNANFDISATNAGASIGSLAGTGTVALGARTLTLTNANDAFSGAISGAGGQLVVWGGTLTLSGTNTYSGGTSLKTGKIMIGNNSALGSGALAMAEGTALGFAGSYTIGNAITVSGDPTFEVNQGDIATIGGAISDGTGPGDVVKTGAGTLVLTAANTYTGGTTISAGTLKLSGNGGIVGRLVDNAAFDISATNAGASIGSLAGSGAVALGARTLTLTAANDTFAGVIGGTGGLTIAGGAGTLTGNNSYTGLTAISAGASLQLGAGGTSGGIAGNVLNNGTLAFNRSDNVAYAGTMSGSGLLRQISSGTLTLTGDSSAFAGNTQVAAGTLVVNGILGGSLAVGNGATLAGTGTIGSTSIASGGTLSPAVGGAIGTLTVHGSLSLAAGSTYVVHVDAMGHGDLVHASGAATLGGGAVASLAADGNWNASTRYTILTADGGVAGTFGGLTSNFAFLTPSLSYDANNVYLSLDRNGSSFASAASTPNQTAVAGALDTLTGGPLYNAVSRLDAATARAAFDQLSGEIHASARGALVDDSRFTRTAGIDRLRAVFDGVAAPASPVPASSITDGIALWTQGYGAWGDADSDGNAADLSHGIGGVLAGVDAPVFDTWRAGLLAGYSRASFDVDDRKSSGDAGNYDVGVYGGTRWDNIGLRLGAAYTWSEISIDRQVAFTGFSDSLSASYDAGTGQAFGELGYRIDAGDTPVGKVRFEPFAGLAYVKVSTDGFSEHGGAAALAARGGDTGVTFSTIGVRASDTLPVDGLDVTASGTLGWRHASGDITPTSTFAFAGSGPFTVAGVPIAGNAAVFEADLSADITRSVSLDASYSGQFGDGVTSQGVRGNLSIEF